MAKIIIPFDNVDYPIDETSLSAHTTELQSHLSTVMNGSGAVVKLGETSYNVDSTKLSNATNDFITHLAKIAGTGKKVFINGVEYNIGSDKVSDAVGELHIVLGGLRVDEGYVAGLYQTGAVALYNEQGAEAIKGMLIKSWDELLAEGTVHVEDGVVYTDFDDSAFANPSSSVLSGDLLLPSDGSIVEIGRGTYNYETLIGDYGFTACANLTGIFIPNSVTNISPFAFGVCSNLLNVIFEEDSHLVSIGESAFINIPLESIIIPDSVTEIKTDAFAVSRNLSNVSLGSNLTLIGSSVFYANMITVDFRGTMEQWNAIEKSEHWCTKKAEIICTDGTLTFERT